MNILYYDESNKMNTTELLLLFLGLAILFYMIIGGNDSPSPKEKIIFISSQRESSANDSDWEGDTPRRPNPLLEYQRRTSMDRDPVTLGDPIRPNIGSIGPSASPYDYGKGPFPGRNLNIPVPQGSLKRTSEEYKYPFYYQQKPLAPYDFFKPYGPNSSNMQNGLNYADDPFYTKGFNQEQIRASPSEAIPFIGSVSSYAPFAEVQTPWEKTGILTKINEQEIVNIYRRPIAPLNDIFDYMIQDKDGFMIPLKRTFLEDGDIVENIPGKGGPWKVHIYVNNKYIWV